MKEEVSEFSGSRFEGFLWHPGGIQIMPTVIKPLTLPDSDSVCFVFPGNTCLTQELLIHGLGGPAVIFST